MATTSAVPAYIYYGHSSLALIIFVAVIVVRLVASQRRRGMGRPSRPTPPQAPGLVGDRPTPPAAAPPSAGPSSGGTAPGWMRDPFFRHEQRYWSGTAWTEHVSDAGVPATDPPPPPR